MLKVVLSPTSIRDIGEIFESIAQRDPMAAWHVIQRIEQECKDLAEFPLVGHLRDEVPDAKIEIRGVSVFSYLIFYRVNGASLEVGRVIHSARDLVHELAAEQGF